MTIQKNSISAEELEVAIAGRLDTSTAPQLDEELKAVVDSLKKLVIDFKDLDYISSAGLRVLLSAHKAMDAKGKMVIKNVNEMVMEVFEVTGFSDILNIE